MHVRVRLLGKTDAIVVVESKLTKIEQLRLILKEKFDVQPKLQRLLYGGKLLEDGYTFHDYNIKLNDVIQLMVRMQPDESMNQENADTQTNGDLEKKDEDTKIEYEDAESVLYAVGDLIDMKDRVQGAWFEGTIVRIVHDPAVPSTPDANGSIDMRSHSDNEEAKQFFDSENDVENKPPEVSNGENSNPKKGIAKYFHKSLRARPKGKRKLSEKDSPKGEKKKEADVNLLYKVQLDGEDEDTKQYCKIHEIRPRARTVIESSDLKVGQEIMINYNIDHPLEKGNWYDFKISEIIKKRKTYVLVGTLYLGPEAVPQNDINVKTCETIYAREEVVPLAKRTMEYQKMMTTKTQSRTRPLNCLTCRDNKAAPCKNCGCFLCSSKEFPEKNLNRTKCQRGKNSKMIILCDECDKGFHMICLTPPLTELPEGDWYCPSCKRDTNDVIAPGAAKQLKKASSKGNRDWGRGMACVGKTKTCSMPANHFGPIPGIEVGMCWRFRIQLSESGVHRPPVSGIHGRDVEGAYSIVLSGGYEDDVDNGYEFTYTGSGGRDLSGNKRTAEQSCDQTLTRENKALARNCAVKQISEEGGDAGDSWRSGKPVRVVRSYKMLKHFPKYAPKEGIRYDGIYKVVKYYPEKGLSGYRVWKYLLRRDDPVAAPWEPAAKEFPIIYPDGYLEAQAEKKALKDKTKKVPKGGKKRALRESNAEASPPDSEDVIEKPSVRHKRRKANSVQEEVTLLKSGLSMSVNATENEGTEENQSPDKDLTSLTDEDKDVINADTLNAKLWADCLKVCGKQGKKGFVEHVTQEFLCIICQDVVAGPVTTPCLHNFCMGCLKQALKRGPACPCCRASLARFEPESNERLQAALRIILPGYDAGRTVLST